MSFIFGRFHLNHTPIQPDDPLPNASVQGKTWQENAIALAYHPTVATDTPVYPLHDSEYSLTLTASMRLDNRAELAQKLSVSNLLSDGQLLLRAYRQWGTDCPSHLLGDFAFVLWDANKQILFAARDFIGTRPFYYTVSRSTFLFASSIHALASMPTFSLDFDLPFLTAYFRGGQFYPHATRTFYGAIQKLAPAHAMLVNATGIRTWRYWHPEQLAEIHYNSETGYVDHLRDLLNRAVCARLPKSGNVASHISSGLDCTTVALLAKRAVAPEQTLYGYCWSPSFDRIERQPDDERLVVAQIGSQHNIPIVFSDVGAEETAVHRLRHPVKEQDNHAVFELPLRAHARRNRVTTILSGWGGDEFISSHALGYLAELFRQGHWLALWKNIAARRAIYGGSSIKLFVSQALSPTLPASIASKRFFQRHNLRWQSYPLPSLFNPEFLEQLQITQPLPHKRLREQSGVRSQQLAYLAHGHLTQRIEEWAAAGIRCGLHYAYPLLDRRIVEFALSIPSELFSHNGWRRYLFRTAFDNILSKEVAWDSSKKDPALDANRAAIQSNIRSLLTQQCANALTKPQETRYLDTQRARQSLNTNSNTDTFIYNELLATLQTEQLANFNFYPQYSNTSTK